MSGTKMGLALEAVRRSVRIIFGLCVLVGCHWTNAYATLPECDLPEGGLSLSSGLSALVDPDLALDLPAARTQYVNGAFQQHDKGTPSYGFVTGALWARVQMPAVVETCTSLFVIEQPRINLVELFLPQHSGALGRFTLGVDVPFTVRSIPHRFLNTRITREAGEPLDVFLRVRSASSIQLPVYLHSESSMLRNAYLEQAGMGVYYGILLALFLYSIAVMIGIRDDSYAFYVLYLAALCLFSLSFTGHGYQYLWPDSPKWQGMSVSLALGALIVCGGSFAFNFLDLARKTPRLGWMLRAIIVLTVPATLIGVFPLGPSPSTQTLTALVMTGTVVITLGAVLSSIQGYRPAYYFLFAWCLQLLGGIAIPLSAFGWIPRTLATEYGLQFGSASEMLLLSFALTYRINLLRERKDQAEREAEREAGRAHLEESLKRSLDERNTILENSMVAIVFLNAEGRVQWANQAMYKVFGAKVGDHLGESIERYYPSHEEYIRVGTDVGATIQRGEAYEVERLMRRDDGTLIWVYMSGRAVNPRDISQGTVWAIMDITRRRQLEENLSRSEDQYRQVVNNVSEGMIVVQSGKFIFINPALLNLLGYAAEEILGQDFLPIVHSDDREMVLGNYTRRLRGEQFESKYDFRVLPKSGKPIWVQISTVMVQWNSEPATLSFISDITQRHQAEEDIRRALAQQVELSALKSKFVSMTSHEFRTPLATILSSAELLRHYSDRLPAEEKLEILTSIEAAVKRMAQMLESILIIGRADSGNLEFKPTPYRAQDLCLELATEAALAASSDRSGQDRLDARCDCPDAVLLLDEKLLRHILGNLIGNAFKYSPANGRVGLTVSIDAGELVMTIADHGIGIPVDDMPRMFETFHRAGNVGNISGTGLGLAIVKRAVDLHGGKIEVESKPEHGTRFTVRLPHVEARSDNHPDH